MFQVKSISAQAGNNVFCPGSQSTEKQAVREREAFTQSTLGTYKGRCPHVN